MLEKKYGEPVLHAHEWPDVDETEADEGEEEEQDLDEEKEAEDNPPQKEEPDL